MWMHYGLIALDVALERTRELELSAERYRQLREAGELRGDAEPPRPGRVRSRVAALVRAFSNAAHAISDAACAAATRIEGRTA